MLCVASRNMYYHIQEYSTGTADAGKHITLYLNDYPVDSQVIAVVGLDGAAKVVEKPKAVDGVQQPTELGGLLGHATEKEKSWVRKMAIKVCVQEEFIK